MVSSRPVANPTVEKLGTDDCPNCNAAGALIQVERRKPTGVLWEMYIVCSKCRGKFPVGLMHDEQKKLIDRRTELMKKYDKAKTPRQRGIIWAEIKRLEKREEEWNQSL
jgi:hypothetical protein